MGLGSQPRGLRDSLGLYLAMQPGNRVAEILASENRAREIQQDEDTSLRALQSIEPGAWEALTWGKGRPPRVWNQHGSEDTSYPIPEDPIQCKKSRCI
jgi:hypothetical protein